MTKEQELADGIDRVRKIFEELETLAHQCDYPGIADLFNSRTCYALGHAAISVRERKQDWTIHDAWNQKNKVKK